MEQKSIEYNLDDLVMEGYYARQTSTSVQPLVLVVHDWSGNRDFAQQKAQYFANLGYLGFAVDLFGKGRRGSDTDKAKNQQLLEELLMDRRVIVPRLQAALDCALGLGNIDANRVMVIGFCLGGLCTLDFARSGADIAGAISVHGILNRPDYPNNNPIKTKILALHGHDDKMVSPRDVLSFEKEMSDKQADWQMHIFGQTMHAFTNPRANDNDIGLKYSELNDRRTWRIVNQFCEELFS